MLESSREIVERAISEYSPYAIVSMVSGGKDSLCAYFVAKELSVPVTHILHGVTGTGIKETTEFVRKFAAGEEPTYIEANAGTAYEEYVRRKGFFGRGSTAHSYAYHILKQQRFRRAVSTNIRHYKHHRPILLLNGARVAESSARAQKLPDPVRKVGPNIWVNICHDWTKEARDDYLDRVKAPCNPVTQALCRSGECLCGTTQNQATRQEAAFYFPEWGEWLDSLEREVQPRFGWGWGEDIPAAPKEVAPLQLSLFQPMCIDCSDDPPPPQE